MLCYISGPYTKNGNSKTVAENIEQSAQIAADLWEMGHAVISPHLNTANFEKRCKATYDQYIAGDLHMICYCDVMIMTPDWETSKGAKIEYDYAIELGIPVYVWPEYPELHPTEVRCPEQVKAFRETIGKAYRLHLSKNSDYSPNNVLVTGENGITVRLWDKVARLLSLQGFQFKVSEPGTFSSPKSPKHESIEDTLLDLMAYSIIGLLLRKGKWGK